MEPEKTESAEKNNNFYRKILPLKDRIEVIKLAEERRDTRELAKKFGCGRTQIITILSQKDRLLREWANNDDPNRLRRKHSPYSDAINAVIFEWVQRCRRAQIPISDSALRAKSNRAKKFFNYIDFRADHRWLERFKRRFKLKDINLEIPDASLNDGVEKSLEIEDIYYDLQDTMDPKIIKHINEGKSTKQYEKFLKEEKVLRDLKSQSRELRISNISNYEESSSIDDICEKSWSSRRSTVSVNESAVIKDDLTIEESKFDPIDNPQNEHYFCMDVDEPSKQETTKEIVDTELIRNNQDALECLKKLEEYAMFNEHFRALGLIIQLEKLYKEELEH